jgi:hypothetical protein
MYHEERMQFFKSLAPGLVSFWALAATLTAYRDYRDTFQREIFEGLGYSEIGMFSESETIVGMRYAGRAQSLEGVVHDRISFVCCPTVSTCRQCQLLLAL